MSVNMYLVDLDDRARQAQDLVNAVKGIARLETELRRAYLAINAWKRACGVLFFLLAAAVFVLMVEYARAS